MCSDPFTDRKLLHKVHWTLDIDVRKVFSFHVYSHPDDFIIEDVRKSESYVENKKMQKKQLFFLQSDHLCPHLPPSSDDNDHTMTVIGIGWHKNMADELLSGNNPCELR